MSVQQGMPLPDAIANAPELLLGLQLYFSGFLDLNDERQIGFGNGPIPWRAMQQYCEVQGIEGEQKDDFFFLVKQMDAEYLKHHAEKNKT